MSEKTNIPSSFIGYNKKTVDELLKEKDSLLETQRQDIEYLRRELSKLQKTRQQKSIENEPEL